MVDFWRHTGGVESAIRNVLAPATPANIVASAVAAMPIFSRDGKVMKVSVLVGKVVCVSDI